MKKTLFTISLVLIIGVALIPTIYSQTTSISYQGSLDDEGSPANGNYYFTFRLYNSGTFGTQLGNELSRSNVTVTNGIFSLNNLDFATPFIGTTIWLEIDVRKGVLGEYTTLSPRQRVNSSPSSIRSITAENADRLGGLSQNVFARSNDSRFSDSRSPTSGSSFYIQNGTSVQSSSNFRISGLGRADKLVANSNLSVGSTSFSNPLVVVGNGTNVGGVSFQNNVVARFRSLQNNEKSAISIDAASSRDSILYFSTNGDAKWSIENDESTNEFQIRSHQSGANESLFRINERENSPGFYEAFIDADVYVNDILVTDMRIVGSAPGTTKVVCVNVFAEVKRIGFCGAAPQQIAGVSNELQKLKKEFEQQRNLIKTQQVELELLKKKRTEIEAIKTLVCLSNPTAAFCMTPRTESDTTNTTGEKPANLEREQVTDKPESRKEQ